MHSSLNWWLALDSKKEKVLASILLTPLWNGTTCYNSTKYAKQKVGINSGCGGEEGGLDIKAGLDIISKGVYFKATGMRRDGAYLRGMAGFYDVYWEKERSRRGIFLSTFFLCKAIGWKGVILGDYQREGKWVSMTGFT